jgi:hypothetical protein
LELQADLSAKEVIIFAEVFPQSKTNLQLTSS